MSEQEHFSAVGTYLEVSVAGLVLRVFFRSYFADMRCMIAGGVKRYSLPREVSRKRAICH